MSFRVIPIFFIGIISRSWALPEKGRAFTTRFLLRRRAQTCRSIPNAGQSAVVSLQLTVIYYPQKTTENRK